jgi:hypothetical protein
MYYVQLELCTNNFGGYKVEEKIYLGVRDPKDLNVTGLDNVEIPSKHSPHKFARPQGC